MSRMAERPRPFAAGHQSPTSSPTNPAEQPPDGPYADALHAGPAQFREMLEHAYPYVLFDIPAASGGDVAVRRIGPHQLSHLRTKAWSAEAGVSHADALGFGETIKLVWQLRGSMTYEDAERTVSVNAGEIFLTRSSSNYFLNASADYEGVAVTFHAGAHTGWLDLVENGVNELVLGASSATAASAAGVLALMQQSGADSTSELVLHSLFELATASANHGLTDPAPERIAPSLFRAHWLVRQNIADPGYNPERLAHDLGLSRRSLYNRFAEASVTPSAFIRMIRLAQAKREIESDPRGMTPLTAVALRNGFPDSSSLSHAVKAAFGISPKELRTAQIKRQWRK